MLLFPLALLSAHQEVRREIAPRFELQAPCPTAPSVMIDTYGTGVGLASETVKSKGYQARMLWIDATANIDRYNTEAKIVALAKQIHDAGFNTVVLDIKPISGQTVYKSIYEPKLTDWRGQHLPADFDPVPIMARECHADRLSFIVSMNAFSEGHRMFKVGPGYQMQDQQTVIYEALPVLKSSVGTFSISPQVDKPVAGDITEFSSQSKLPHDAGGYAVAFGSNGVVKSAATADSLPKTANVSFLWSTGAGAEFLRQFDAGSRLQFDSTPNYIPMGDWSGAQIPLMMNPNDEANQDRALNIIREVVSNYDIDGVVYDDRLRFSGLNGDFSSLTRDQFEKFVGHSLQWPDDVFKYTVHPNLSQGVQPGRYYDAWIDWRAKQIRGFVQRVHDTVRKLKPGAAFGAYVGSWYGDYAALGHNYASPLTRAGFWFLTPGYQSAGTANLLDFLVTGCYYPTATIYEAMGKDIGIGYTVEAAGALVNRLVRDETWTYAGIDCGQFAGDPQGLSDAVQAACACTQGVMVFDLSHGMDALWPVFAKVFAMPKKAPHQVPGSVAALRSHRRIVDGFHQPERPIIIAAGSSGAGQ